MTRPKLTYFDFNGGRGEDCRLALHIAGVDFEDNRVKGAAWREMKPSTPFGALPVLEIDGRGQLSQSNAILAFIGRGHGLLPDDAWEAARHESILNVAEELRSRLIPTSSIKDEDEKKAAREEFADGFLKSWATGLERQIEGPFVGGADVSVADLKIYVLMKWFKKGGVDYISPEVFADYPKLSGLFDAVGGHERVKDWNDAHA